MSVSEKKTEYRPAHGVSEKLVSTDVPVQSQQSSPGFSPVSRFIRDPRAAEKAVKKAAHEGHRLRLRERYDKSGFEAFADHEVLEFALTYIIPYSDVKPQAKALLKRFGDIPGVFAARRENLMEVPGIGPAAARFLHVLREIAQIALKKMTLGKNPVLKSAADLVAYLGAEMSNLQEEQFRVVFLDHSNTVIKDETLSHGIEEQTAVYPRKVMKRALALHATGIIVAHNHPTGLTKPSKADIEITRALAAASATLDIRFLDHLILGREGKGYFSFRENDLLS
ncbi:MAG: DNA repair protein RadC [Candidatus Riflebacteria bacterium]|nr:DNA repair protein RadC [Candidatus Riflebacteria bacterium]